MREGRNKRSKVIQATVLAAAFGIFCLSIVDRPPTTSESSQGSARLVSGEQLPDYSEWCAPGEPLSAIATLSAEFEENRLVGAFRATPVYAAATSQIAWLRRFTEAFALPTRCIFPPRTGCFPRKQTRAASMWDAASS